MTAFYNENDPAAVAALEYLIAAGMIAPGKIDSRSIKEIKPHDLEGFTQHHFFAGFGGWSMAARLAGWADDRPIWTASCPCQPWSGTGRKGGADDPRHLWPDLYGFWCIARPAVGVGEQVAGRLGFHWFDGVRSDLARSGYASRAVDIPALAVDAPHQRQRLYWIAVADAEGERGGRVIEERRSQGRASDGRAPADLGMGDAERAGLEGQRGHGDDRGRWPQAGGSASPPDDRRLNGTFWTDSQWITCGDGKARRTQPGLRFLADGLPGRVDLWRLAGNGIVLPLAAQVLGALKASIDAGEIRIAS